MAIEPSVVIDRLQTLAPFADADAARRAWRATLQALRSGLTEDEADWLAIDLGPELAAPLVSTVQPVELTPDLFYRSVARFAGQRQSVAREQAQVVCRTLAELLSSSTIGRLRRSVPRLASLFLLPEVAPPPFGPRQQRQEPGADHTLAGGRPGGDHPLYEARRSTDAETPGASASRGHTHSVAVSDDPHGDTKLSSSRGLSQERQKESLASARHPVIPR
jgi:uncharacterized protein (DUF2267 family)